MAENQIRLKLHDFRAIKEADIILDGITVVAGENACGKSTLSKFLYCVFKQSNEYDQLVDEDRRYKLEQYSDFLSDLNKELRRTSSKSEEALSYLVRDTQIRNLRFNISKMRMTGLSLLINSVIY